MEKINFTDTIETASPYVTIDGVDYEVKPGQYNGGTDLNAETFNTMQDNIEEAVLDLQGRGNYSLEEQKIGTWIDGKPLYRKTMKFEVKASGSISFNHNISNVGIFTNAYGMVERTNGYQHPITRIGSDGNYLGLDSINNSTITLYIDNDFSTTVAFAYITLEYTKTTD